MSQTVLLNNIQHQSTRVIASFSAELGDAVASVQVFPTEFIELQKEYAILFRKDADSNQFQATVLLGTEQNENVYLDATHPSGWAAFYVPASVARGPFMIGYQTQQEQGEAVKTPVVHIDMQHPKVNEQQGAELFLEQGGNSPYLQHISKLLEVLHQGIQMQSAMFTAFESCGLIEPVNINFELKSGEKRSLVGNYTINENALRNLSAEQLQQLNQQGFLSLAYAVVASTSNIGKLIERKNNQDSQTGE
ncbi:SapC family protein [Neptunicella marina]|uniref:SapC family protein n=1 Tax=Neptunicella marina TaxID=2125989 RepID=A0A8J6IV62_9ALTE|nr:SapC family protein [Neptunicella marina]MBC3766196.1 SapC family protein [Neptunicella marina]